MLRVCVKKGKVDKEKGILKHAFEFARLNNDICQTLFEPDVFFVNYTFMFVMMQVINTDKQPLASSLVRMSSRCHFLGKWQEHANLL